ncbi:MAG: preprotein translocase subunit YajC [Nocardioides sp.]|nr:preprotein translocase subunit YajC [Nocardioides sp.]
MEGLAPLLPLLGIVLVFWLLVIRPGARRERERRSMQASLVVGDRVVLTSGFFGTIAAVHDDRADITLAPGTTVSVALGAIGGLDPAAHDAPAGPDLSKKTTDPESSTTSESEES